MKPRSNPLLRHSLVLASGTAFLAMGSAYAVTYDWDGDTNSNFTDGANWVGGSWDQWSDYTFGAAATSGAVTINDYFGIGSLSLQNGLTTDIVITSSNANPVIMHTGIAGSATIAIASDSKNLTINGEYIAGSAVTWDVGAGRTLTMNGPLNNWFATASLIKNGAGTALLTGANGYTGATNVNNGILQVATQNGLASSSAITVANGAELSMTAASNNTLTVNTGLTLNGGTLSSGGGSAVSNYGNFHLGNSGSISVGNDPGTSNITGNLSVDGRDLYNDNGGFSAITVGDNSTLVISGNVTGVSGVSWGGVSKYGNGTLKLTGTGDYAQGMYLAAGTVEFEENAMSLRNASSPHQGYAADFAGNATLRWATGNTQDLSGNGGNSTYSASQIRIGDGVTATLDTNGNDVTLATAFSLGGSQTGALTKAGTGTLSLTAANSYSGGTTINAGTLAATRGSLGSGAVVINNGGTLNLADQWVFSGTNPYNVSFPNPASLTVNTGGTLQLDNTNGFANGINHLYLNGGLVTGGPNDIRGDLYLYNGNQQITAGGTTTSTIASVIGVSGNNNTITVGAGSALNITAGIKNANWFSNGSTPGGIIKAGNGTLTLTAANSYTGTTEVNGGKLALQNTYASSGFSISSGATLELNVDSGSRDLASASFSGTGTLTKTGAGSVIWAVGSATFALGGGSLIDVQEGVFGGGSNANEVWTSNLAGLNVASGAIFNGVEANVRVDALTGAGTITSGYVGAGYENFTFGVNNGSGTFSGSLTDSDSAAANFVKAGSGTQTLTGTLDYNGTTTVSGGTLALPDGDWQTGGRYASGGASGTIIVGAGATLSTSSGVTGLQNGLVLNGGTVSSRGLNYSNYRNLLLESNITAGGAATSTISSEISLAGDREIAVGTDSTLNITGGIANDGFFGGSQGITKTGDGTLTLAASNNTYTGATVVTDGTLVINGNISTSSLTTVQTGASLGGSGTVGSLTVNSGAFVNPGNSPGILTVDGDYNQAGTLTIEITGLIAGSQHDQLNVDRVSGDSSVSLSGSLVTAFSGGSYANGNLIFILLNDESDAINGTFSGLAQDAIVTNYGGFDWKISYTADSTGNTFTGGNDVALMAVPEPNVAALLGGLGILALLRRRR